MQYQSENISKVLKIKYAMDVCEMKLIHLQCWVVIQHQAYVKWLNGMMKTEMNGCSSWLIRAVNSRYMLIAANSI
jgi:hypothetical protein